MLSFQMLLAGLVGFTILYYCGTKIQTHLNRKKLAGIGQCEPIRKYPQHNDPLGLKWMKEQWKAYKSQTYLEAAVQRFETIGDTFQGHRLGGKFIQTRDPENVKAILTTNFNDFGLGHRLDQMGPVLG